MKRFPAFLYLHLAKSLQAVATLNPKQERVDGEYAQMTLSMFEPLEKECEEMGLRCSLETIRKIRSAVSNQEDLPKHEVLAKLSDELHGRMVDEMKSTTFLYLEPSDFSYFETPRRSWSEVIAVFESTTRDIEEASKCLALSRYTACAFHLMRVAEVGVRALGAALRDPTLDPKANPTWDRILGRSEKELQKPLKDRSPEWKADESFFSTATANLRAVQYAWRNPGLHVERDYNEEEAREIYSAIRGFMRHISTKLAS